MKNILIIEEDIDFVDIITAVSFQARFHGDFSRITKGSSVGYVLTQKALFAAKKIKLLSMAFSYRKDNLIGLACGISHHIAGFIPFLDPLTESFNTTADYPVYITLCVDPDFRNRGLATMMLSDLIKNATLQNFKHAIIDCTSSDHVARKLLSGLGFEDTDLCIYPGRSVFMKPLVS